MLTNLSLLYLPGCLVIYWRVYFSASRFLDGPGVAVARGGGLGAVQTGIVRVVVHLHSPAKLNTFKLKLWAMAQFKPIFEMSNVFNFNIK